MEGAVSLKTTNELSLHPWFDQSGERRRTVHDALPITSSVMGIFTFSNQTAPRGRNVEV